MIIESVQELKDLRAMLHKCSCDDEGLSKQEIDVCLDAGRAAAMADLAANGIDGDTLDEHEDSLAKMREEYEEQTGTVAALQERLADMEGKADTLLGHRGALDVQYADLEKTYLAEVKKHVAVKKENANLQGEYELLNTSYNNLLAANKVLAQDAKYTEGTDETDETEGTDETDETDETEGTEETEGTDETDEHAPNSCNLLEADAAGRLQIYEACNGLAITTKGHILSWTGPVTLDADMYQMALTYPKGAEVAVLERLLK